MLTPEFGPAKVFRPYRDVRFSHDKTPYKTHQGAVLTPEGRGAGSWYVQISADGLMVSGGSWRLESDQIARYRRAVADPVQGARLDREVERLRAAGWDIGGDRLVRVPRATPRTTSASSCSSTRRCTPAGAGPPRTGCTPRRCSTA